MKSKLNIYLLVIVGIFILVGCKPEKKEVYLTQLTPISQNTDFEPIVFGNITDVYGKFYPNGIFTHANSRLVYSIPDKYSKLKVYIGLMGVQSCGDGATFKILTENTELYRSKIMKNGELPILVELDITGATILTLVTESGPDGNIDCDHSFWGDPLLIKD